MEPTRTQPLPLSFATLSLRPSQFQRFSRTMQDTSYQAIPAASDCCASEGILRSGQPVWLERQTPDRSSKKVIAYVDGIGLVNVNWHALI